MTFYVLTVSLTISTPFENVLHVANVLRLLSAMVASGVGKVARFDRLTTITIINPCQPTSHHLCPKEKAPDTSLETIAGHDGEIRSLF